MKPPEEVKRELLRQWMAKAEGDFKVANHLVAQATEYSGVIGFHAQQAAEKYLKAFLVQVQVEFPKTHDIDELLDLVAQADANLANSLRQAIVLTPYGVEIRYPGELPEVTPEKAREAIRLAEAVRSAVLSKLDECK